MIYPCKIREGKRRESKTSSISKEQLRKRRDLHPKRHSPRIRDAPDAPTLYTQAQEWAQRSRRGRKSILMPSMTAPEPTRGLGWKLEVGRGRGCCDHFHQINLKQHPPPSACREGCTHLPSDNEMGWCEGGRVKNRKNINTDGNGEYVFAESRGEVCGGGGFGSRC